MYQVFSGLTQDSSLQVPSLVCLSMPVLVDTAIEMPCKYPCLQAISIILFCAALFLPLVVSALFVLLQVSKSPVALYLDLSSNLAKLGFFYCLSAFLHQDGPFSQGPWLVLLASFSVLSSLRCFLVLVFLPLVLYSPASRFMLPTTALFLVLFVLFAMMALVVLFLLLTCLLTGEFSYVLSFSCSPLSSVFVGKSQLPILVSLSTWVLGCCSKAFCFYISTLILWGLLI